jgi:hypothetical protein
MNATHKKKLADLIVDRLGMFKNLGGTKRIDLHLLNRTLDALAKNGLETVVRHRSRQGEHYYNRRRKYPHQRRGEARFKYDPAPKAKGKINLNLLMFYDLDNPAEQRFWKQVWVSLDKETALKMLVLGFLPETIGQS